MSAISRTNGSVNMTDVMMLFAKEQQSEVKEMREARDAAFAEEVHCKEGAIAKERQAAMADLAGGLAGAMGKIGEGAAVAEGKAGEGKVIGGFGELEAVGFKAVSAELGAEAKLRNLDGEKARHRVDDLGDAMHEAKRLRDGYVDMMKKAIDDEKRTSERIRG